MKKFIIASRPKTLIVSISPVVIGTAMAIHAGYFQFWIFLFSLLTGLGIQISTNVANDLFDFLKGADTPDRKGFLRVTSSGLMSVTEVKWTTASIMTMTALFGSVLVIRGGIIIGCLLCLALLLALVYTAGPYPIAYLGIAEFFVLIFLGPVATGCSYFLQTLELSPFPFIAGLAPGLISCGPLVLNNLRDVEEDRRVDKKTLVVRFGILFGKGEFIVALSTPFLIPFFFFSSHPYVLTALFTIFPTFFLIRSVIKTKDPYVYNTFFGRAAKLLLLYTLLFSMGYLL